MCSPAARRPTKSAPLSSTKDSGTNRSPVHHHCTVKAQSAEITKPQHCEMLSDALEARMPAIQAVCSAAGLYHCHAVMVGRRLQLNAGSAHECSTQVQQQQQLVITMPHLSHTSFLEACRCTALRTAASWACKSAPYKRPACDAEWQGAVFAALCTEQMWDVTPGNAKYVVANVKPTTQGRPLR